MLSLFRAMLRRIGGRRMAEVINLRDFERKDRVVTVESIWARRDDNVISFPIKREWPKEKAS